MKKILTILTVVSAVIFKAQNVITDNNFGNNGIYSFTNQTFGDSIIESVIQPDGKILVAGQRINGTNNSELFVARLNTDGTLDTSFATNGFYTEYQNTSAYDPHLYTVNDKILIFYPIQGVLIKLNINNGTPDTAFGTNGILYLNQNLFRGESVLIGSTLYAADSNSLHVIDVSSGTLSSHTISGLSNISGVYAAPNGNLLLKSYDTTNFTTSLTLINTIGIINTSFGVNGTIVAHNSPSLSDFESSYDYITIDNSNNVYYAVSNDENITTIVKKIDSTGNFVTNFGTNGAYQYTNNITSDLLFYDNKLYLSGANLDGSNLNLFLSRLNTDGTLDNTFNNNGIFIFDTNSFNEWAESLNIISPTTIIIAGEYSGTNNNTPYVGKFIVTPNLSTTELDSENIVHIENPVKSELIIKSSEKIDTIQLFSVDGKLVKSIKHNNNTQVSDLTKGIYIVKIKLQNGKVMMKKIIKE